MREKIGNGKIIKISPPIQKNEILKKAAVFLFFLARMLAAFIFFSIFYMFFALAPVLYRAIIFIEIGRFPRQMGRFPRPKRTFSPSNGTNSP